MASPLRLSAPWRALFGAFVLLLLVLGLANPVEARRFRFGLSGGGSSGGERIEKVLELPRIPELKLDDGRYVDIGRIRGGANDGKLVGYVGSGRAYLNLPYEQMTDLVKHAGFDSVEALERHLAAENEARVEAAQAKRQEAQSRAKDANEERRRNREAGGETAAPSTSSGPGLLGGLVVLLVMFLVIALGALAALWPFILIGIAIWLALRWRKGKLAAAAPSPAHVVVADAQGARAATSGSRHTSPAPASRPTGSDDFAALASRMPVAVRYSDESMGSMSLETPKQLAALLGQPTSASGASPSPSGGSVAQQVSRRGVREGRIAQPRAFGKRG